MSSTIAVAHRGLRTAAPESSWKSFTDLVAVARAGHRIAVEFDIRATKDGTLLVNHDATSGPLVLREHRYNDLRDALGPRTPLLLEDVLQLLSTAPLAHINPELKETDHTSRVLDLLDALGNRRSIVSSFHPGVMTEVKEHGTNIEAGLLVGTLNERLRSTHQRLRAFSELGADYLITHGSQINRELVEGMQSMKKGLGVYTVNDPRRLAKWDASGDFAFIVTDKPEILLPGIKATLNLPTVPSLAL